MALPTSGSLSLSQIRGEFGGSTPDSLSEYYGAAAGVPSSGTIKFSDFYGKSAGLPAGQLLYSSPGNVVAGSSFSSPYLDVYIWQTIFDYQQSGNIAWVTMNVGGAISCEMKIDPTDHFGRANNSGDDRSLQVSQITGSGASISVTRDDTVIPGQPGPTGWASNTGCFFINISNIDPGDIFQFYMDNASDWRDNQGYEQIEDFYIYGA